MKNPNDNHPSSNIPLILYYFAITHSLIQSRHLHTTPDFSARGGEEGMIMSRDQHLLDLLLRYIFSLGSMYAMEDLCLLRMILAF